MLPKQKLKGIPYRFLTSSADRLLVRFTKDKLREVTSKQTSSYQLEIIKDGRLGYGASNQPNVDSLVDKAVRSSEFGDKVNYSYPAKAKFPKVKLASPRVKAIKKGLLVKLGQYLLEEVKKENRNILVDVVLQKTEGMLSFENSLGLSFRDVETELDIALEGELVSTGDILAIGDYFSWRDNTFEQQKFAKSLREKFRLAKKIVKGVPGTHTVVFSPEVLSVLLSFFETTLSAVSVYKKLSVWGGKLGNKVLDSRLSLIDDPTIDYAAESTMADNEGFPAQPLILIENGVLKNFYTDLRNAHRLKITPNGRGFGIPSTPGLTNLIIPPGDKSRNKIISGINKGLWIDQIIGGGQDNPYAGDFSFNIHLGYLIDGGEVVGRVKNLMVSGNVFEMFAGRLGEISSERVWVGGSMNLPFISFNGINIAGG